MWLTNRQMRMWSARSPPLSWVDKNEDRRQEKSTALYLLTNDRLIQNIDIGPRRPWNIQHGRQKAEQWVKMLIYLYFSHQLDMYIIFAYLLPKAISNNSASPLALFCYHFIAYNCKCCIDAGNFTFTITTSRHFFICCILEYIEDHNTGGNNKHMVTSFKWTHNCIIF